MAGGLLIALYLLLITPLRLGVWLHCEGVSPGAAVGVRVWGAPGRWRLTIGRGENGAPALLINGRAVRKTPQSRRKRKNARRVLYALLRADKARGLLLRGVQVELLTLRVQLGGGNAAAVALAAGALRAALCRVRRGDVRVTPAFGGGSALRGVCIVSARLGMLLVCCAAGLLAYARAGKKEG